MYQALLWALGKQQCVKWTKIPAFPEPMVWCPLPSFLVIFPGLCLVFISRPLSQGSVDRASSILSFNPHPRYYFLQIQTIEQQRTDFPDLRYHSSCSLPKFLL